jgi:hypothetical protein
MWRTLRDHPLVAVVCLLALVAAFLLVAPFLTGQQQRVTLLKSKGLLMSAYREFTNTGSIGASRDYIWLSSNTVAIGNTQYQCFLELRHGGGTLAMTTNLTFVWLGPTGVSRIIPTSDRPSGH